MSAGLIRLAFVRPDMSDESSTPEDAVRVYYEAIDAGDYDQFADLFAPEVVHRRPDRTIEGRDTLVEFVRDGRPNKDTSHEIRGIFGASDASETDDVAVEGRLLDSDGDVMFRFVDVFAVESDRGERSRIEEIRTYTR